MATDPRASERFDLVAVGGGTAGLVAAAGAVGLGARVALVERDKLGGECLWNGCVPTKALIAAGKVAHAARQAERFGITTGPVRVDLERVMRHVHAAIQKIAPHDSPERFRGLGVDVREGEATIEAPDAVRVDGRLLWTRHLVIATGSRPAVPPIAGLDTVPYLTNESIFDVTSLPKRLAILGAGPIGLEMAQAFARLGSEVRVLEAQPTFLPREDHELAALLLQSLRGEGLTIALGSRAERVSRAASGAIAIEVLGEGGARATVEADALLVATGRQSRVEGFGLDAIGVRTGRDGVAVDERLATNVPNVWACGDVVGGLRFTHVADYEARLVLRNALFPLTSSRSYRAVPWVTFTDPELAHVGLTEREARAQHGGRVQVHRRPWQNLDRAIADGNEVGMLKLITDGGGRILGGHVLGYGASGVIGEIALAMAQGISARQLGNVVHAYPTYNEAAKQAAEGYVKEKFTGVAKSVARWIVRR